MKQAIKSFWFFCAFCIILITIVLGLEGLSNPEAALAPYGAAGAAVAKLSRLTLGLLFIGIPVMIEIFCFFVIFFAYTYTMRLVRWILGLAWDLVKWLAPIAFKVAKWLLMAAWYIVSRGTMIGLACFIVAARYLARRVREAIFARIERRKGPKVAAQRRQQHAARVAKMKEFAQAILAAIAFVFVIKKLVQQFPIIKKIMYWSSIVALGIWALQTLFRFARKQQEAKVKMIEEEVKFV